jgi:hypothetical protein
VPNISYTSMGEIYGLEHFIFHIILLVGRQLLFLLGICGTSVRFLAAHLIPAPHNADN